MPELNYYDPLDRGHPVHQPPLDAGNRSIIVFVTVCTKNRRSLLATREMHGAIAEAWRQASYWMVGRYVILPDHIHLFCAPAICPPTSLQNWVRFWKSRVAHSLGVGSDTLWQKNFWDTQLRCHESYEQKWDYVRENPVRAGLVSAPEDWPF